VPVRTFGEWTGVAPGALQADLVVHCGETTAGFYLSTLLAVDVAPIWGMTQQRVGTAVHLVRQRLPVALRELHTDNGGEFLNTRLVPWCRRAGIRLTRGRPYRKNDQAWAEQRNWTAVRSLVGYDRYASLAALAQFRRLYPLVRDYLNFFQPVRKLVGKHRDGAKVTKRYDAAQTPYRRLLASGVLDADQQARLDDRYHRLNPAQLKRDLDAALDLLWTLAEPPPGPTPAARRATS